MYSHMTFTAAGDALILKHIPRDYPDFTDIASYISRAEARIINLETTLSRHDCWPSAFSGGTWLTTEPEVFAGLLNYGFNMIGLANNHALDYSYPGLESTLRAIEAAEQRRAEQTYSLNQHSAPLTRLCHAGAGRNLHEAERPGILDLPSGRVGIIAVCSTFEPSARAGRQSNTLPGRPGLNPLRFGTEYTVTREHMRALKDIAAGTFINGFADAMVRQGFKLAQPDGVYEFGGMRFREGTAEGKRTYCNPNDLRRITHMIADALRTLDYVVIMVHSHEMCTDNDEQPDFFLEEFAHATIDAGACAVVGGGTHQLKPIEIYRQRPIFYSLGNFIFQNEYVDALPPEFMEKQNLPDTLTASEAIAARTAHASASLYSNAAVYQSVLPYFELRRETAGSGLSIAHLELKPITLGRTLPRHFANWPHTADSGEAHDILEYINRVSEPYGTRFRIDADSILRLAHCSDGPCDMG